MLLELPEETLRPFKGKHLTSNTKTMWLLHKETKYDVPCIISFTPFGVSTTINRCITKVLYQKSANESLQSHRPNPACCLLL